MSKNLQLKNGNMKINEKNKLIGLGAAVVLIVIIGIVFIVSGGEKKSDEEIVRDAFKSVLNSGIEEQEQEKKSGKISEGKLKDLKDASKDYVLKYGIAPKNMDDLLLYMEAIWGYSYELDGEVKENAWNDTIKETNALIKELEQTLNKPPTASYTAEELIDATHDNYIFERDFVGLRDTPFILTGEVYWVDEYIALCGDYSADWDGYITCSAYGDRVYVNNNKIKEQLQEGQEATFLCSIIESETFSGVNVNNCVLI